VRRKATAAKAAFEHPWRTPLVEPFAFVSSRATGAALSRRPPPGWSGSTVAREAGSAQASAPRARRRLRGSRRDGAAGSARGRRRSLTTTSTTRPCARSSACSTWSTSRAAPRTARTRTRASTSVQDSDTPRDLLRRVMLREERIALARRRRRSLNGGAPSHGHTGPPSGAMGPNAAWLMRQVERETDGHVARRGLTAPLAWRPCYRSSNLWTWQHAAPRRSASRSTLAT
jgi:hypothetical protein